MITIKRHALKMVMITFVVIMSFGCNKESERDFNPEIIKSEILAKFNKFNKPWKEHSVEEWDTYFLNSQNIGNMHLSHPEIGWEAFHKGSVKFFSAPLEGTSHFDNLKVYPINSITAWLYGDYDVTINDNTYKSKFYDTLIKTDEGWKVILSVVVPVKEKDKQ